MCTPSLRSLPRHRMLLSSLAVLLATGGSLAAQVPILISPALPTTSDTVHLVVEPTCMAFYQPTIVGNTITLQEGPTPVQPVGSGSCPAGVDFPLGTLAAGSYTVRQLDISGNLLATSVFQVNAPATDLNMIAGSFQATLSWQDAAAAGSGKHVASAVQVSDGSGYFWFFEPTSTEVSLKILDGTAINGSYWVFVASATTVPFDLTVTHALPTCGPTTNVACAFKVYTATAGTNQNFIDLNAFSSTSP
jgi:hypothetical protein